MSAPTDHQFIDNPQATAWNYGAASDEKHCFLRCIVTSCVSSPGYRNGHVCASVCVSGFVRVCGIYVVHHFNGKELHSQKENVMMHKGGRMWHYSVTSWRHVMSKYGVRWHHITNFQAKGLQSVRRGRFVKAGMLSFLRWFNTVHKLEIELF